MAETKSAEEIATTDLAREDRIAGLVQNVPRRIVTGHDENGVSVILSDGKVPVHRTMPQDGVGFYEVWQTDETPAPILSIEESEPTERTLRVAPETNGSKIRINEFFPGFLGPQGWQSPMHRTESIDYAILLEGEIVLILDNEVEVTMHAGDVAVQRGTMHAWANRSDSVARIAFILVGGVFHDDLLATLPTDVRDNLLNAGPHDGPQPHA